jgi:hypothetical protein
MSAAGVRIRVIVPEPAGLQHVPQPRRPRAPGTSRRGGPCSSCTRAFEDWAAGRQTRLRRLIQEGGHGGLGRVPWCKNQGDCARTSWAGSQIRQSALSPRERCRLPDGREPGFSRPGAVWLMLFEARAARGPQAERKKPGSSRCRLTRSQRRWPAPFAPRALPRSVGTGSVEKAMRALRCQIAGKKNS